MYTQIPLSIRISISIAPRIILSYLDENPFPKFVNLLYIVRAISYFDLIRSLTTALSSI